jgi:protein-tyrosine phosphatase
MNKWRSPTAEVMFKNHPVYHAKSAGVSESARTRISDRLITWADQIFVMEKEHKRRIMDRYGASLHDKPIIVLDIADDYQFMDPELIDMIKLSVRPWLEQL